MLSKAKDSMKLIQWISDFSILMIRFALILARVFDVVSRMSAEEYLDFIGADVVI